MINKTKRFIKKAVSKHGKKYDYSKVIIKGWDDKLDIGCPIHGIFTQRYDNHLSGKGCHKCVVDKQTTGKDGFVNKGKLVHGDTYNYSKVIYKTVKDNVIIICKIHNEFEQTPDKHINAKQGCPVCRESKGEAKISKFLIDNSIQFKRQFTITGKHKYDFYLTELNILIEYDGIQHFKAVKHWGGLDKLKITQENDKIKNNLAKLHSIPLIRIPYINFNNLEKYLLVKLSNVYKYKVDNTFYKNYLELLRGNPVLNITSVTEAKKYLSVHLVKLCSV